MILFYLILLSFPWCFTFFVDADYFKLFSVCSFSFIAMLVIDC